MNFCPKCGKQLDPSSQFCSGCGYALNGDQAAPAAPSAYQPQTNTYYQPQTTYSYYNAEPQVEVSTKDKTMGFVGMGLGIGGLFFAVLGILYTLVGMDVGDGFSFGMAIGFGIFSMPLSILGRKFANDSLDAGNESGAAKAGTKLGLAGIIVSAVMFFFGFISLMM